MHETGHGVNVLSSSVLSPSLLWRHTFNLLQTRGAMHEPLSLNIEALRHNRFNAAEVR